MARKLHDIQPGEVSLVHRGANKRRFLLAKSGEVEFDETIAKILDEPAADEAEVLERVRKAGGDEEVLLAASAYARLVEAIPADVLKAMKPAQADLDDENANGDEANPDDETNEDEKLAKADADAEHAIYKRDFTTAQRKELAAKGHALPNMSYPIASKADIGPAITLANSGHGDVAAAKALIKRRAKELGAEDQLPDDWKVNKEDGMSETAQAVPVKKEDGSWDLTGVPEENRAAVEAVIKATEDEKAELQKAAEVEKSKADEAIKIAKAERDERETRDYIAKSAGYEHLAKADDEFGPVLKSIANAERDGALPEGTAAKLDEVLKAADEQIAKGDLFAEKGRSGHGTGGSDAMSQLDAAAAEIRKADSSLTKEQATARALRANPDLYNAYQAEVA